MLKPAESQATETREAPESASSLLVAYASYLLIAAITVSASGRISTVLVWLVMALIAFATSRFATRRWSLYNGVAAGLFFSTFASKPFGDVHIQHVLGWAALGGLIVISFLASAIHNPSTLIRERVATGHKGSIRLPWMDAIPSIGEHGLTDPHSRADGLHSKEDKWLM